MIPRGMPRYCGRPAGSYQSGEPHELQNTRSPPPESYFVTCDREPAILKLSVGTKPQAAYAVPENCLQLAQWQNLGLRSGP